MSELKLELGEYYLNRIGQVQGPITLNEDSLKGTHPFTDGRLNYRPTGIFNLNGYQSEQDIVEHIPVGDPRHPRFIPASKIPGMALKIAEAGSIVESDGQAPKEVEVATLTKEEEELLSEENKPFELTAGRWITDYGYVITLDNNQYAEHWCPGENADGQGCGSSEGWTWRIDGTISGLAPEWTVKLRIVGPAPEAPESPAGFKHKSPPEFRVPRRDERFIRLDRYKAVGISRGYITEARWIIEPEVVSIPLQTEREWLGVDWGSGDDQTRWVPTEQPIPVCELEERYCVVIGVGAMMGLNDEVVG